MWANHSLNHTLSVFSSKYGRQMGLCQSNTDFIRPCNMINIHESTFITLIIFRILGIIIPTDELIFFQRGRYTTNHFCSLTIINHIITIILTMINSRLSTYEPSARGLQISKIHQRLWVPPGEARGLRPAHIVQTKGSQHRLDWPGTKDVSRVESSPAWGHPGTSPKKMMVSMESMRLSMGKASVNGGTTWNMCRKLERER